MSEPASQPLLALALALVRRPRPFVALQFDVRALWVSMMALNNNGLDAGH